MGSYLPEIVAKERARRKMVVSFEERKKTAIPSRRGLYPAEILLLNYCLKCNYPDPQFGYPKFWWYWYGIRDVNAVLKTLEERGYIALTSIRESVQYFTVPQLQELLFAHGQPIAGRKSDLVARAIETVPEGDLIAADIKRKYRLTELGQSELEENAYIPYMHGALYKTKENDPTGLNFNVWSINQRLGTSDKSNWRTIVDEEEQQIKNALRENRALMPIRLGIEVEEYENLVLQSQQLLTNLKIKEERSAEK